MFEFVRRHNKIMMVLMFLVTIPAFVVVGVNGYRSIETNGEVVAKVGSHSISQSEWDAAHKYQVDRLRANQPQIDPKLLDSPEARYGTLERLVRDQVLAQAVQSDHLTTSDAHLARALQSDPSIAALRKPDGSLDMERYTQLAASQGLTPQGFEARVRSDLSLRQLEDGVKASAFAPKVVADVALNAFFEKREVQLVHFNAADFAAKVHPSDADVEAYYKANQTKFQAPEAAKIEYVVLDLENVKKSITVSDADVKDYYQQNAARLSGKEERRASHILINAPKSMPAAQRDQAQARALALLEEVRKAPDKFADIARKNSQDPGSAAAGGDLDYFARGAMVKPFEDAAFALKKGEVSGLVESDFGYHIIKLTDIKAPKQRSLDELRATIEADLRNQLAQRKFADVADTFTNGVYEQADSLKPIAEKLKLDIRTAEGVQRTPAAGDKGVLTNAKLLAALFQSDSLEKKHNTEAIETGPSQLVSARITSYEPAHTLPIDTVRAQVRAQLVASQSADLARAQGVEKLAQWKANAPASLPAAVVVSRESDRQTVSEPVLDAVLHADVSKLPVWVGVADAERGYTVVRINKLMPRVEQNAAAADRERKQFAQWLASAEDQAYYQWLMERFKVQFKVPKPLSSSQTVAAVQ